jgi:hypothetical protein
MAQVVNLRTARKRAKRKQDEARANGNRLAHGRPKSERKLEAARREQAGRNLERHRIETGDGR